MILPMYFRVVKDIIKLFLMLVIISSLSQFEVNGANAYTEIGGPIISDTTWSVTNSPYIVTSSVEVLEGVVLTIEPGVNIKFHQGKILQVSGTLIAQGTVQAPIEFTSNEPSPEPGDWGNIEFTPTATISLFDSNGDYVSGSILRNCLVEYAGYDSVSAINAHSLLVDNCIVRNNAGIGIYDVGIVTSPARITGNQVIQNKGVGIFTEHSIVTDNVILENQNSGGEGGGVYAEYSTLSRNSISNNYAKYGGGIYTQYSKINNNIVSGNSSYDNGGGIYDTGGQISNNKISNNSVSGPFGDGGGILSLSYSVISNTISNNSAHDGGGIFVTTGLVQGNVIFRNHASSRGGGIFASQNTLHANFILENSAFDGGGIYAYYKNKISGNIISRNTAQAGGGITSQYSTLITNTISFNNVTGLSPKGAGVYVYRADTGDDILGNTIVGNQAPPASSTGGIEIIGTSQVHYNNFYGNQPYDVTIQSSVDISGTYNYWGTIISANILDQVVDWYDDPSRGKFIYIPYLQEPDPESPLPAPLGFDISSQGDSVTLSWRALPSFKTGWGYKIYYDTDESLPPYDGIGLNEGNSPIDVGDQTTYTLTGFDSTTDYYFTVTSYDNEGQASWYSNVVQKQGDNWIYLPITLR